MKQAAFSSRTADKFVVRLPEGMRDRIASVARQHHRSMNSEIIARLEHSLSQDFPQDEDTPLEIGFEGNPLSSNEMELLQRFRQLSRRQQNALIALIAQDTGAAFTSAASDL